MEKKENVDFMREQPYAYWLHSINGIGNKTIKYLLSVAKTAENVYDMTDDDLHSYLKPMQLKYLRSSKNTWDPHKEYEKLEKNNIYFYNNHHPKFPSRLRDIPDAPYAIYVRGKLPKEDKKSIAVIGARLCSEYGRYVARKFGMELAKAGIQVVSGLASGIDGISQKAVIEAGGETFSVLGCGVDICYPKENEEIFNKIPKQGGIISEYCPGTLPKSQNFPPRNRIISGLSDAVLVIEAKQKSGSFITVDMALEQGREVYVIPGRVTDTLSIGCNRLIKQGAGIILSPEDLLSELSDMQVKLSNMQKPMLEIEQEKTYILPNGPEGELCKLILRQLDYMPQSVEIIWANIIQNTTENKVTIPLLLQELLYLQMREYVAQIGGQYCLVGK